MKQPTVNRYSWLAFLLAFLTQPGFGQLSSSNSQAPSTLPPSGTPLGMSRPVQSDGQAGGGSLADFTELIALIQSTVKSNWDIDGGEDTVVPYPNGVWIDPTGKLHRQKNATNAIPKSSAAVAQAAAVYEIPQLGTLQSSESVRWISLSDLEAKLNAKRDDREKASPAMELLGGLTRIDYVARDPATGDWLLGGPAGDLVMDRKGNLVGRATGLPPVLLEDLLSVAPLVLNGRGPMGCSIDPVPERLKAASELAVSPMSRSSLAKHAEKWCERLAEALGDQQATVFGLPEDSPTGIALLVADEHMKRIGLGLENGPARLKSYWEEAEKRGSVQSSSLIRWWFALRDDIQIGVNESETVFAIESPTVRVMSQRQWMDQTGARHEANREDRAADGFAAGFTEHYAELQTMYPAYGRLRHIFDLCVALRIVREEVGAGQGKPLGLLMDKSIQPHASEPLKWIPSIAAWRKTSNGRVSAIVSGGVSIDIQRAAIGKQPHRQTLKAIKAFELE